MITSSLIIGAISTIATIVFRLLAVHLQSKRELREAELKALNAQAVVTEKARRYGNKGFQFTRRFIAIAVTVCVMVIPFLAVMFYQWEYPIDAVAQGAVPHITFGYDVVKSGFWPFTSSTTETVWKTFNGIVITPWHTQMFSWVMGMYFGNRIGDGRH